MQGLSQSIGTGSTIIGGTVEVLGKRAGTKQKRTGRFAGIAGLVFLAGDALYHIFKSPIVKDDLSIFDTNKE